MRFDFKLPVEVSPERAWTSLSDLATVAACFPGAKLAESSGTRADGEVEIKLGPVTFNYRGAAEFVCLNDEERRGELSIRASDEKGGGNVNGRISFNVEPDEAASSLRSTIGMGAEIDVGGRAAQFGRGAMEDVANRILEVFVSNLEQMLTADGTGPQVSMSAEPTAIGSGLRLTDLVPRRYKIVVGTVAALLTLAISTVVIAKRRR